MFTRALPFPTYEIFRIEGFDALGKRYPYAEGSPFRDAHTEQEMHDLVRNISVRDNAEQLYQAILLALLNRYAKKQHGTAIPQLTSAAVVKITEQVPRGACTLSKELSRTILATAFISAAAYGK